MKLKKIARILTIISILFLFFNTICFAEVHTDVYKPKDLKEKDYKSAFEMASTIVEALTTVGTVIAVVGIMIMGIKYMLGSVEQKAEYKKTMIPYIVGCIFIFAISQIVSIIYSVATQL